MLSEVGIISRRLHRLFFVVTIGWAFFCLFVLPIRMAVAGRVHYEKEMRDCYDTQNISPVDPCLAHAKAEFESGLMTGFGRMYDKGEDWSYGWYFRTQGWFLVGTIVIPPVLIYGALRSLIFVMRWIWVGPMAVSR